VGGKLYNQESSTSYFRCPVVRDKKTVTGNSNDFEVTVKDRSITEGLSCFAVVLKANGGKEFGTTASTGDSYEGVTNLTVSAPDNSNFKDNASYAIECYVPAKEDGEWFGSGVVRYDLPESG